jgi:hypothetical protein
MQPAIVPGTQDIVAVARTAAYSNMYLVDGNTGQVLRQLSHNQTASATIQLNHWMFGPASPPTAARSYTKLCA